MESLQDEEKEGEGSPSSASGIPNVVGSRGMEIFFRRHEI